jgi:hypothetical protein
MGWPTVSKMETVATKRPAGPNAQQEGRPEGGRPFFTMFEPWPDSTK